MKEKLNLISLLFLILSINFNCKSQDNCNEFYEKFVEYQFKGDLDSALQYIDKAILCNSKNVDFKYEKVKLLIEQKKYTDALAVAKTIKLEPVGDLLQGVLELKMNAVNGKATLKKAYETLKLTEDTNVDMNFTRDFNLTQLVYFFENREIALNSLSKFENKYTQEHQKKTLKYLRNLIEVETPNNMFFKIYNMDK